MPSVSVGRYRTPSFKLDAQARPEALLGMGLGFHDRLDQRDGSRADRGRLAHYLGGRPFRVAAMRARHMLCDGRVPVANRRERMARNALALVEDLNSRAGDTRLDHLADQLRRHRVIVAGDLDVIIGRGAGPFPFRIAVGRRRQRIERRTVDRLQQLVAVLADAAHDLGVDGRYAVTDRRVQLDQREEAAMA